MHIRRLVAAGIFDAARMIAQFPRPARTRHYTRAGGAVEQRLHWQ
jgi:hypothetical protein